MKTAGNADLHAFHFPFQILFLDGLPLVELFLSTRKRNEELRISVVGDEKLDCNDGKSLFLDRSL